jgi:hypothetical protein
MGDPEGEKKPLDLKLSALAVVSLLAGAGAAAAAGFDEAAVAAGVISLFVVVAAIATPQPATFRAAVLSGVVAGLALLLAHATGATPFLAGISMAAVALLTGAAVAGGPTAGAIGSIIGTAYFAPAALSLTAGYSLGETAEVGLAGLVAGLAVVAVTALLQRALGDQPRQQGEAPPTRSGEEGESGPVDPGGKSDGPGSLTLIANALRHPSPERNYGMRRALLLGTGMGTYLATDNHNVFWVLLTIFSVLKPRMESTWTTAIARSKGAIAGALAVGVLAQVLPTDVVVAIGLAALVVTLAYYRRSYAVYSAGISFLVVALLGEQQGDLLNWAALRAADTLLGAAIAITAVYLILPEKEQATRAA